MTDKKFELPKETARMSRVHVREEKESQWPTIIIFGLAAIAAVGFGLYVVRPEWFSWLFGA